MFFVFLTIVAALVIFCSVYDAAFDLQRPWTVFRLQPALRDGREWATKRMQERDVPTSPHNKRLLSLKEKAVQDYRTMN